MHELLGKVGAQWRLKPHITIESGVYRIVCLRRKKFLIRRLLIALYSPGVQSLSGTEPSGLLIPSETVKLPPHFMRKQMNLITLGTLSQPKGRGGVVFASTRKLSCLAYTAYSQKSR